MPMTVLFNLYPVRQGEQGRLALSTDSLMSLFECEGLPARFASKYLKNVGFGFQGNSGAV